MTFETVMDRLRSLGDAKLREHNAKWGVGENQFGVKMGDIRAVAKEIKFDHDLGLELWESGNLEARFLATLIMRPKQLSVEDLERMVAAIPDPKVAFCQLADWLGTNLIKPHPNKESVRERWMDSDHPMVARMGWSLTTERVIKTPDGIDLNALLNRIENEMAGAPPVAQWTMNYCLAEIGIRFPEHRPRAIAIGEKIGAFRDYPVSKGCTSPYAPIWIAELSDPNR